MNLTKFHLQHQSNTFINSIYCTEYSEGRKICTPFVFINTFLFCPAILKRRNVSGTKITLRSYKLENNTFKKEFYFSGRNIKLWFMGKKLNKIKSNQLLRWL